MFLRGALTVAALRDRKGGINPLLLFFKKRVNRVLPPRNRIQLGVESFNLPAASCEFADGEAASLFSSVELCLRLLGDPASRSRRVTGAGQIFRCRLDFRTRD